MDPITLDTLRAQKNFLKATKKQQKELDGMRKRHMKERLSVQKQQCSAIDKASKGKKWVLFRHLIMCFSDIVLFNWIIQLVKLTLTSDNRGTRRWSLYFLTIIFVSTLANISSLVCTEHVAAAWYFCAHTFTFILCPYALNYIHICIVQTAIPANLLTYKSRLHVLFQSIRLLKSFKFVCSNFHYYYCFSLQ